MNKFFKAIFASLLTLVIGIVVFTALSSFVSQTIKDTNATMVERSQAKAQAAKDQAQRKQTDEESKQRRLDSSETLVEDFEHERRRAFDNQYTPPEGCEAPQSEKQFTECINHKMRSKRSFFTNYGLPPKGAASSNKNEIRYGETY